MTTDLERVLGYQDAQNDDGEMVQVAENLLLMPFWTPEMCDAVIHAAEIDDQGNARIYGSPFWDHPLTRAAKRVLVTAEKLVTTDRLREQPELTLVPGFMVEAAAVVPRGGWPGSMHPHYEIDYPAVERYMEDAPGVLERHLAEAPECSGDATARH